MQQAALTVQSRHCAGVRRCGLHSRTGNQHRTKYLDDFGINLLLLLGSVKDDLLNSASTDQNQHQNFLFLANAMRPVLCLLTP